MPTVSSFPRRSCQQLQLKVLEEEHVIIAKKSLLVCIDDLESKRFLMSEDISHSFIKYRVAQDDSCTIPRSFRTASSKAVPDIFLPLYGRVDSRCDTPKEQLSCYSFIGHGSYRYKLAAWREIRLRVSRTSNNKSSAGMSGSFSIRL